MTKTDKERLLKLRRTMSGKFNAKEFWEKAHLEMLDTLDLIERHLA